jgi:hypothetical protein
MRTLSRFKFMAGPFLLWAAIMLALPLSVSAQGQGHDPAPKKELQQRIDFGNAHILGQSIKSGAVYLMHRKKSDIKNMLEVRKDYRKEIIEDFSLEKTAIAEQATQQPAKDQQK